MSFDLAERHLYLCTPARDDLVWFLTECITGGVVIVQLRDKEHDAVDLLAAGRQAAAVCADLGVPFLMNDRPDLALDVGADGVHVGQDDVPVALCRRILGAEALIGLSTHASAELQAALATDATYLSAVPVFVTGGVTPERVPELAASGISHFVVVRHLTEARDPRRAASELRMVIDQAISER